MPVQYQYFWKLYRWKNVGFILFIVARYFALANAIVLILPERLSQAVALCNLAALLRFLTTVAAEAIITVRTWAILGGRRSWSLMLSAVFVCALVPCTVVMVVDVRTTKALPDIVLFERRCPILVSNAGRKFAIVYGIIMSFEFFTLILSVGTILRWRKKYMESFNSNSLLTALYYDGIFYFICMLLLGIMNIALVLQTTYPQLRIAGGSLHATLHSMLSTRIITNLRSKAEDVTSKSVSLRGLSDMVFEEFELDDIDEQRDLSR
ncbi:hypothetical protein DL96DRAFT_1619031 [Flagelloscypha sp. PMI_526]|nr:hypothetical protein DL96DRAFT_1619031 [Flagelloscypha sp. PMI_526]